MIVNSHLILLKMRLLAGKKKQLRGSYSSLQCFEKGNLFDEM